MMLSTAEEKKNIMWQIMNLLARSALSIFQPKNKVNAMITKESLKRPNFTYSEFFHSNTAIKLGIDNNTTDTNILTCLMVVADKAQELRDKLGVPIYITSGYRCRILNDAVGGSPNSKHILGLAIDCNAKGYTPEQLVRKIKELKINIDKCFVERGCVHIQVCIDPDKNKNYFAYAERIDGVWVTKELT